MKKLLLALLLLAGCREAEQKQAGGEAADGNMSAKAVSGGPIATLTGLYEGGQGSAPRNQLCMVENSDTDTRFGLVVWGGGQHSCSGSGSVERSGDRLQLKMTGDEACTINARIAGNEVVLPEAIPEGCAYYCGARATMNGARFAQVGTGREEAAKAKDLVGDSIC